MSAATSSPPPSPPDPGPASVGKVSRFGRLLGLVRKLVDYGKELVTTLREHAPAANLETITCIFGTRDIAQILARITRGLHLAAELDERLVRLEAQPPPPPSRRAPRPARPAAQPARAADSPLDRMPTPKQIAAAVRQRPIGAVLADICFGLGIVPPHPLWHELQDAIMEYGGNLIALVKKTLDQGFKRFLPEQSATEPAPASPSTPSAAPLPACTGPP